ncbi:CAP domain-containing protein [Jiella sp. M17.18]|uniref:CAP domain-containing protein n=1 Tax=Jiella sp. M17.18 TaxID=3234247 RepID=UPI0034DFF319
MLRQMAWNARSGTTMQTNARRQSMPDWDGPMNGTRRPDMRRLGLGRRLRGGLAAAVLAATLAGCAGAPGSVSLSGTHEISVDRGGALAEVNRFRARSGLPPVRYAAVLDKAAERQARAMAAKGELSHTLDGDLRGRLDLAGYDAAAAAENIGWNYASTAAVMTGWENSAGHRANLLNPRVTEMGFAAATGPNGQPYWALVLGTPDTHRRTPTLPVSSGGIRLQ